ncbi:glycosyltransferase [Prosthecochloris sp. N3]|uniref:Glycosyltransferase n=1 Tax=Prosthecochloris ethylica TaxID=2743976 RepID=A0ABR9XTR0_9CHLB|nr:glycosyltransferase [Prosthecochloris ethylica]MBF0587316.1 glycosyltransferase [Prosthecochloris ethylica]MBF0637452.1 glycosyltransferase [Prosthecochloris ethylica]NUK48610.1 glycosyltransferase [Prosthecochloris ethylica]
MSIVIYSPVHKNHDHNVYSEAVYNACVGIDVKVYNAGKSMDFFLLVIKNKPRIVIYAVPSKISAFLMPVLSFFCKKQIVLMHDQKPHSGLMWLPTWIYNIVVRLFSWVIVFNRPTAFYRSKCIGQVSLGGLVDDGLIGGMPFERRPKKAIFFGRWKKYRGIDRLPNLCDCLNERDWEFWVLSQGAGELGDSVPGKIIIKDEYYTKESLAGLLSKFKLAVFPYFSATQSGAIIEALGYGATCLVQDIPELRDQLKGVKGVVFIDFDNPSHLSYALDRIEGNLECVDLRQLKNKFSFDGLVAQFYSVIKN